MLVAAKALLDANPDPNRDEVIDAISGNICRCTGYEPIINAILVRRRGSPRRQIRLKEPTMEHIRDFFPDERAEGLNTVGVGEKRTDADGHVTGKTQFYADRTFPGMLHLKMARSPHDHARILHVDTSAAEKMPGVVRVLTHKDVPSNIYTILRLIQVEPNDEPVLADDKVRFKGEQIVAVVAETEAIARDAAAQGEDRLRGPARGLRRRGGAEARRADRQRVSRPQLLHL